MRCGTIRSLRAGGDENFYGLARPAYIHVCIPTNIIAVTAVVITAALLVMHALVMVTRSDHKI